GTLPPNTRGILQLATGANHTLALLDFDDSRRELLGCGDGRQGQLGPEHVGQLTKFTPISCLIAAAWEMSYLHMRTVLNNEHMFIGWGLTAN
ncbi:uncharacterized protein F5891DRAFT_938579, partial [Suillus fuscotomentosus]